MTTFPYLAPWLQCLLRLVPPSGLVHVGAGGGSALPYPFASMPRLLAVEAEAAPHASLQAQLKNHAHCQVVQARHCKLLHPEPIQRKRPVPTR